MKRVLLAMASAALVSATPDRPTSWPCHFAAKRVVGCGSSIPENAELAAHIYQSWGLDTSPLDNEYTRQELARSFCRGITSPPGKVWKIYSQGAALVLAPGGREPVLLISLPEVGQFMFIAAGYVRGECPKEDYATKS